MDEHSLVEASESVSTDVLKQLHSSFLPSVSRLQLACSALIEAMVELMPTQYSDDLAKLARSVERMVERSTWITGIITLAAAGDGEVAAGVRHDLRTPMSGVLGYAEMLLEEMESDGDRRFVRAIDAVVNEANVVLKEISDLLFVIDSASSQMERAGVETRAEEPSVGAPRVSADVLGRILVVDDNPSIRELVERRLQKQGHTVTACVDGEAALLLTGTESFDLIMLDLMMPGLSGVEVLQRLKRQPRSADIPVIVMSALDELDAAVRCIEAGADDYLSKPLNTTLLTARINTLLERKFLRDREQATLAQLKEEQLRSDLLLHSIFPASVVKRLGNGEEIIADHFSEVSVLFCDLVGFTEISSRLSPIQTLQMLNGIFSGFDTLAEMHGVEKIKTIGDAYLLVAGIPDAVADPAWRVVTMARQMGNVLGTVEHAENLKLRIGISMGPAAAGVVGTRKLFYDVWGHTVNLASRLEALCSPGRILVSSSVQAALADRLNFERNEPVMVRGIGAIDTYYLRLAN